MSEAPAKIRVSMIVAVGPDYLIGTATGLPWHLPADLKRFRKLTIGKPVIIGRKTLEAIGGPLKDRPHIVLTHQRDYMRDGCHIAHTIEESLAIAKRMLAAISGEEIMVIGGAEVYRAAMPFVERIYLTVVDGTFAGTTYLPEECRPGRGWKRIYEEAIPADEKNRFPHRFEVWERDGRDNGSSTSE